MALVMQEERREISDDILITIMENSVYFDYYFIFIMKSCGRYWLYGEKAPGKPFRLNQKSYRSLAGAKRAAEAISIERAIPLAVKKGCKPKWGPLICPGKKWRLYKSVIENRKTV